MSNLKIKLGTLELDNPLMIASSPITAKLELLKEAEDNGFGSVSIKHIMAHQNFAARPRWYCADRNVIVSGDPRLDPEYGLDLVRRAKEETGLKIICNMSGKPGNIESWGELAAELQQAGADAVELNFNCPNLLSADANTNLLQGANLSSDPEACGRVVAQVRGAVNIPIIVKLNTESGKAMLVAKSTAAAGADIINIHASYRCAPALDIYNGGRLMYPGSENGNFGAMSGPWARMASNRFIADAARAGTGKPIMGGSGISTWQDVVEAVMYGAECVQLCSSVMQQGFGIGKTILSGLCGFVDAQGYKSIHDMCGIALRYICNPGQMKYTDAVAHIDETRCVGCRRCANVALCTAISYDAEAKKCRVNGGECIGCGMCRGQCARGAIYFDR